jgi:tetratricopeptide (TPR) repeat protein
MFSRSEIEKFIAQDMQTIQSTLDRWNAIIPEKKPAANFRLGLCSRGIAIYNLLLGNKKEALKWFEKAAEYYDKRAFYSRNPPPEVDKFGARGLAEYEASARLEALDASIFSRNPDLVIKMARRALSISEQYPLEYPDFAPTYYHLMTLAHIILGGKNEAKKFNEKLKEFKSFKTAYLFGKGMIDSDIKLVEEAIKKRLEEHKKKYGKNPKMDDELVSISATRFLLLAKDEGMNLWIEIESEYIPRIIFE